MKKWFKSHIVLSVVSTALIAVVGVPFAINELYKLDKGYITVWTGPELLAYYGTIVGAAATIIALVGTILFTRRQIQYEQFVQAQTTKWKKIEELINSAIILAEPMNIMSIYTAEFCSNSPKGGAELVRHSNKLLEAMNCIDTSLDVDDELAIHDLRKQLRKLIQQEVQIARQYGLMMIQSPSASGTSSKELAKQVEDLRSAEYNKLLVSKMDCFSEIYRNIDQTALNFIRYR